MQTTSAASPRKGRPKGATSFDAPTAVAFGQALRIVRIENALTQEQLGLNAGIAPTFVGQLERGQNQASFGVIVKLASALSVTAAALVARAESQMRRK